MTLTTEAIYLSPNRDRLRLVHDPASGRSLVRHEANPASGRHVTDVEAQGLLRRNGHGPEHAALRHLLAEREGAPSMDG